MPRLYNLIIKSIFVCLCVGMISACSNKTSNQQSAKSEVVDDDGVHYMVGQIFSDRMKNALYGPELIVIPGGIFQQGALRSDKLASDNEKPHHQVDIPKAFAISRSEITVAQFRQFIESSGYQTQADRINSSSVFDLASGKLVDSKGVNWQYNHIGKLADDDFPVVHVSFEDAIAYTKWLSSRTNKTYTLPSESEWEFAFRAGAETMFPWGKKIQDLHYGNLSGGIDKLPNNRLLGNAIELYSDGNWGLAATKQYRSEGFGTFDMLGNVSEWVEDCWHDNYRRSPANGEPWVNPGCKSRVIRGSSWLSASDQARCSFRMSSRAETVNALIGFRVKRVL